MAERRQCTFAGCERSSRPSEPWCSAHLPQREVAGWRDRYCRICGFGPRVSLVMHVIIFHDGVKAYRRRFGVDALMSESLRSNQRTIWSDRIKGGVVTLPRRQRLCDRGHRLAGDNVIARVLPDGRIHRTCRRCSAEQDRRRKLAKLAWHRNKRRRKCRWCRDWFMPRHPNQRYCCARCRRSDYNRIARDKAAAKHEARVCTVCARTFVPTDSRRRICYADECKKIAVRSRARAWRESALANDQQPQVSRRMNPLPDHGTRARYARGCRCPTCRGANAAYARNLRVREN